MWILIVIIIVIVIWVYASSRDSERKREYIEARQKSERETYIRKCYPNAYSEYWGKFVDPSLYYRYHGNFGRYSISDLKKADINLKDTEWAELENRIKNKIKTEKIIKDLKEWENAQNFFAARMRILADENLHNFGSYTYTYDINTNYGTCLKMTIWQHFAKEVCLEKDLDYTYNQIIYRNNQNLPNWQKNGLNLFEDQYKQIEEIISKVSTDGKVVVFFNEEIDGWNNVALCNTYLQLNSDLPESVKDINVALDRSLSFESKSGMEVLVEESPDYIVVIDAFTTNERLKKNCENIFNTFQDKHPVLAYISFIKSYDREEMTSYIEHSKAEAEKIAAEEKAKEEDRKRREKERAQLLKTVPYIFAEKVKCWECLYGNFYYNFLFYYYPVSLNVEANDEEWLNRRNVWDFKNDPARNILPADHENTLKEILPQIKQKLSDTFGDEYLQFLTLVCLPASTKIKNVARYEEFSNRLCAVTGMENGYLHTHIVKDGMSKNDPNNPSKLSIYPEVLFDDWFKGKYVLLFDDVITNGKTMLRYKEIMQRIGAIVIGGFSLGKTKHERPNQYQLPHSHVDISPLI